MTAELGTVRAGSVREALGQVPDLLAGSARRTGDVIQVLVFRQGSEWLATATLFDEAERGEGSNR